MTIYDELNRLNNEKIKIAAKEKQLIEQRKAEIANLAENYGILALPDAEIQLAFENLVYNHYKI